MKLLTLIFLLLAFVTNNGRTEEVPEHFKHVDQVIWVVDDLDKVIDKWKKLGFEQLDLLGEVLATTNNDKEFNVRMAVANLGGAHITWIQPLSGKSVFLIF
jgi:hypothetical protein